MRRFVLGAVSALLTLGVAVSATARKQPLPDLQSKFTLETRLGVVPSSGPPAYGGPLSYSGPAASTSTLQEILAAPLPNEAAKPREKRIDLRGQKGARHSLALFVDRNTQGAPRQSRLRLALPGAGPARPTFFANSSFDPWRGPVNEPGPGATARILGSERRFEERQGRFSTGSTGRAGFAVELGGR